MSCYDRTWRRQEWVYIDEIVEFSPWLCAPPHLDDRPITSVAETDAPSTEAETEQP